MTEIEPLKVQLLSRMPTVGDTAVDWIVDGLVPRSGVMLLVARPGAGKSMIACHIGACVAAGLPVFGHHAVAAGSVVYLDLDMHRPSLMRMRAYAAFRGLDQSDAAIERAPFFTVCDRFSLDLTNGDVLLDALTVLGTVPRLALVVVDTFSDAHTGKEQSSDDMTLAMRALVGVAMVRRCGVLVLHHARKNGVGTDLDDVRGSTALVAKPDTVFLLRREGDDAQEVVFVQRKARLTAEAPPVTLTVETTSGDHPGDLLRYSYRRSATAPQPERRGRPPTTEVDSERILDDLAATQPALTRAEKANHLIAAGMSRTTAYRKVQEHEAETPPPPVPPPPDDLIYTDDTPDDALS